MGADIFKFEAGRVYLVQFPATQLFEINGSIIDDGTQIWEYYFATKKQALLLKEVKFIQGPRSNNSYHIKTGTTSTIKEKYITLRFMHPEEPSKTLEWSGYINNQFDPEGAIRSACSIFRPLEYHDRYKNFWKKRNACKEEDK